MDVLIRRCLLLVALLLSFPSHAGDLQLREQEIKAGLLYNFLKYTQWPEARLAFPGIQVCVFGSDPLSDSLKPMAGRTVNRREITVRRVQAIGDADDCHLLFVGAAGREQWPRLRQALSGKSVLTVSDMPSFASEGGMIEFGQRDQRIHASLNMDAVDAAGLHIEDRMLRLVTLARTGDVAP